MKLKLTKRDYIYLPITLVLVITTIILSIFLVRKNIYEKSNNYYEMKVSSFAVQNANSTKNQIIFIGDSITDLYPLDYYYSDLDLATYNRGIGGDTTDGVLKRLQVSLFDLEPAKIVLMIGTNDINGGRSVDYVVNNYEAILDQIKTNLPTTEVYCMSITSYNNDLPTIVNNRFKVIEANSRLKPLVESKGYTYLDLFSLTSDTDSKLNKNYSDDGIHLNGAGFTIWTNLVKPYLD